MATISTTPNPTSTTEAAATGPASAALLVSVASMPREAFEQILEHLGQAFAGQSVVVATPDAAAQPTPASSGGLHVVGYTPAAPSPGSWTLVAADFLNAHELAQQHQAHAVLLLGTEAQSLEPGALRALADAVLENRTDLAVPRYTLPARAGLVNSAILYPVSRALFGTSVRFPLAIDLGLSSRMLERLATAAQRFTAANQPDALLWPVAEAAVGGCTITQIDVGTRTVPQPAGADLNTVLAQVTGSLFADIDAKAAFWQRSRLAPSARPAPPAPAGRRDDRRCSADARSLSSGLQQSSRNLVAGPSAPFAAGPEAAFHHAGRELPHARFPVGAHRLRLPAGLSPAHHQPRPPAGRADAPLSRLGGFAHVLATGAAGDGDRHIEAVAAAFEADKPYLVSRWRWPDRFNP